MVRFIVKKTLLERANLEITPGGTIETKNGSVVGTVLDETGQTVRVEITEQIRDYLIDVQSIP